MYAQRLVQMRTLQVYTFSKYVHFEQSKEFAVNHASWVEVAAPSLRGWASVHITGLEVQENLKNLRALAVCNHAAPYTPVAPLLGFI